MESFEILTGTTTNLALDFETIAAILWQIWKARNNFVFRRHRPDPIHLLNVVSAQVHTAKIFNDRSTPTGQAPTPTSEVWRPPIQVSHSFAASSALQAETQAFSITLKYLIQQGRTHDLIVLESDCLLLVKAIHNDRLTPWEVRPLLAEIAVLLRDFSCLCVQHCKRAANFAAD